jgi:pimeloyl-ACP methyl ester carboxylesterase
VKKAVVWASVFDLTTRLPKNIEEWKEKGVIYQLNGRTRQEMPLFYQFYENTILNKDELSIAVQGKKISIPFCIIHGKEDTAVSFEDAEKLHEVISTSELILMENTGHTFGSSHPWIEFTLPKDLAEAVQESIRFLKD